LQKELPSFIFCFFTKLFHKNEKAGLRIGLWEKILPMEVKSMVKRKANHVIPGANAAKAQGQGAGFNEEMANEPLSEMEKQNNKKRKKNQ
jgi:small acid-soluble spore protein O (minor)